MAGHGEWVEGMFVEGEPVLSGGRGQDEWQESIRESIPSRMDSPFLAFVVSDLRRRGHSFDLDNLLHPVLMALDEPVDRVAACLYVGNRPGLFIESRPVAAAPENALRSIYLDSHSETSDRNRTGIPEIQNDPVFDEHEGIGLMLKFDRDDIPIRRGWFGPTEAVVDDLIPWFGTYTKRELIADHRIRDPRMVRGVNPHYRGVRITFWYVPDKSISVPSELLRRIQAP